MKKLLATLFVSGLFGIFVNQASAACAANFSSSNVANVFSFTDLSTSTSGSIVTWFWNFGDLSAPATTQNPTHTYDVCGVYNVTLTIATSLFCTSNYSATVTVNSGMSGSFTYTVDTSSGNANFNGAPLAPNVDYAWDFGDGNTGTGALATNSYSASGTYYVCLTVSDTGGLCTDVFCDSVLVYISPTACASTFSFTDNGDGNVNFTASPFDFDITYNWDFGDGATATGFVTFHTYPTAGSYYACLTAIDSSIMCTSVYCDSVILAPDPTACNFTFTYFDLDGTVGFAANPPTTNSYSWDFGNGQTGTGAVDSVNYATGGNYYVCCTLTDAFNACTNTYCDSISVSITGIAEQHSEALTLLAYPNPVKDQLTVDFVLSQAGTITLELLDVIGNAVYSNTSSETLGKHSESIPTGALSKGAYLLKLTSDSGKSGKLIIKN